ncbi:MAG TPA: TIGR02996 domain-containing protein, partial [Kofleriaceae bacterium]
MDRAAQLEAAIAEAPERREPYLVYADYLLEQGDRRGTLIMEHAAGNARQALARELALQRDDVEQTWFMGFIETARIKSERPLYALEELFAHPSGKFIQQLAFDRATPGLVPFLIAHAPKTLARVQVGPVGMWTPPSELVEAFPRMWVGIELARAAERAKSQRLGTGISPGALPAFP